MNSAIGTRNAAVLSVFCLAAVHGLFAQTTGDLRGTIKDPAALVISGANVKATLEGTSTSRTVVSDAKGDFVMPALPVGSYLVEVEAQGFKKFIQRVQITLGHVVVVDARWKSERSPRASPRKPKRRWWKQPARSWAR